MSSLSLSFSLPEKNPPIHHLDDRTRSWNHHVFCCPGVAHRRAQSSQRGKVLLFGVLICEPGFKNQDARIFARAALRLLFYCARLNDHEEIKLLPPCASASFPINIYFQPRKRHLSCLSFVGRVRQTEC